MSTYVVFLVIWLIAMTGVQTFFNVVPLVMRDAFSISATVSSLLFLVGAAIGTLLYPVAGKLAAKFGPGRVFLAGLLVMLLLFLVMYLANQQHLAGAQIIGSFGLIIAAGAAIGAIAPSFLAVKLGYPSLTALAAAVLAVAILVGIPFLRKMKA
ncbi:hypothetical protein [Gulosibacter chungangensis]|uniref:MFS transporter n=1 Tax=Gulosibacter chungangensis TaxID=979746 RepID=A0A7J5BGC9_9MICO|nr:hypothetical protein [Gulosibacter chungangensis]KAB1645294.1 hypothetical protein F8O05_03405 [Gulosibacter chungangensis]